MRVSHPIRGAVAACGLLAAFSAATASASYTPVDPPASETGPAQRLMLSEPRPSWFQAAAMQLDTAEIPEAAKRHEQVVLSGSNVPDLSAAVAGTPRNSAAAQQIQVCFGSEPQGGLRIEDISWAPGEELPALPSDWTTSGVADGGPAAPSPAVVSGERSIVPAPGAALLGVTGLGLLLLLIRRWM